MKPRQLDTFAASAADLPLFSGTPQRAQDNRFQPAEAVRQSSLFNCPYCQDTGRIQITDRGHTIDRPCDCVRKEHEQPT